jgi:hypothetical protein
MSKRTRLSHNVSWAKVLFIVLSCIISFEFCEDTFATDSDQSETGFTFGRKRARSPSFSGSPSQSESDSDSTTTDLKTPKKSKDKENDVPNKVNNETRDLKKHLWKYLRSHLSKSRYQTLYKKNPRLTDLCGYVQTHISTELLKRDHTFSQAKLSDEESTMLDRINVSFSELQVDMQTAQTLCSPLRSPSALKPSTVFPTPHLRLTVSRIGIKEVGDQSDQLRQPVFASRVDLMRTREQTHRDIDAYVRALQMERAREIQEAKEQERIAGMTRSAARLHLQTLREGGTERVFTNFTQWLESQEPSELSRSEINQYFIANMAFLFTEITIEGVRFFYNPMDIDTNLSDSRSRSNPERLLQGLNAVYEAWDEQGKMTQKQRTFDWHHIAQEQLPFGSIVVCIPQEIHHNPLLHPFNEEGSQIDRHLFSILKREANAHIAQTVVH